MPFAKAVADVECTPGVVCWAPIAGPLLQQQEHQEVAPTQQRPQTARGLVMNQQSWQCIDCLNQFYFLLCELRESRVFAVGCILIRCCVQRHVPFDTSCDLDASNHTLLPSPHLFPSPIDTLTSWRGCTCKQVTLSSILVD